MDGETKGKGQRLKGKISERKTGPGGTLGKKENRQIGTLKKRKDIEKGH